MPTPPDPLSSVLQTWRHEPPASPHFNPSVWARIEAHRSRSTSPTIFSRWALPLAASIALLAGASAGFYQADQQHDNRMAAALVRSVDPLQMSAHHHHSP